MSKFWVRFWWAFTFMGLIGLFVMWIIPEPIRESDALPAERTAVSARIREAQSELTDVRIDKVKAHGNRVVEVEATYIGEDAPPLKDRTAWGQAADDVALLLATKYLPEGWQVNVALWYRRLPRGFAGRTGGSDPQGGPAPLYRN